MLVLGIDPGLAALGYGLVRSENGLAVYVGSGTFTTNSKDPYHVRLMKLFDGICGVIEREKPDVLVMERPIYAQNVKTAQILGQAGGMALLAGAQKGLTVMEFTPLEIKKSVVGKGRATKEQIQRMVAVLLKLPKPLPSEHACDALACAISYVQSEKRLRLLGKAAGEQASWKRRR
jgi:crossover junction endodeoxyribonuclease RuvC